MTAFIISPTMKPYNSSESTFMSTSDLWIYLGQCSNQGKRVKRHT